MFFNYKGVDVFYEVKGEGEALVFLHGYMEEHSMWSSLVADFSKTHRCITIDLFGHGKTASLGYIHSMEEMAKMVKAITLFLGLKKYALFGHSMGGYVALALVEIDKSLISHICLINSTPHADNPDRILNRNRAISAIKKNKDIFVSMAVTNLFSMESRGIYKEKINEVKKLAAKTSLQGLVAAQEGMKIRKSRLNLLHEFTGEKLILLGKNDPVLTPLDVLDNLDKNKANCKILEGGHMLHIENSENLAKEIMLFIE